MNSFDPSTQDLLLKIVSENIDYPLGAEIFENFDPDFSGIRSGSTGAAPKEQKMPYSQTPEGGNYGVGGPVGKKKDTGRDSRVLFGDYDDDDLGLATAAGAYAIGKTAKTVADTLDKYGAQALGNYIGASGMLSKLPNNFLGQIARAATSKAFMAVPGLTSTLLRNIAKISGSEVFDANVSQIGTNAEKLAFQGAGSPWVKPVLSGDEKTKRAGYDPNRETDDALQAAKRAEEIAKYRGLGHVIP
jgi:hypothetical protein